MNNAWDEIEAALSCARVANDAADSHAESMAVLLVGRLRHVTSWRGARALAKLKRELRDFDIRTNTWKSP